MTVLVFTELEVCTVSAVPCMYNSIICRPSLIDVMFSIIIFDEFVQYAAHLKHKARFFCLGYTKDQSIDQLNISP